MECLVSDGSTKTVWCLCTSQAHLEGPHGEVETCAGSEKGRTWGMYLF